MSTAKPDTPAANPPAPNAIDGLLDLLPVAVLVLGASDRVRQCNRTAHELFGPGEDWWTQWRRRASAPANATWDQLAARARADGTTCDLAEVRYVFSDERSLTLNLRLARTSRTGELVAIVQDVTPLAELRKALADAETMASVGRLAARVAHELNNPLDGSLRYLGLGQRLLAKVEQPADADPLEKLNGYLEQARAGLLRMARIVADLLAFSRNTPTVREGSNINRAVEDALQSFTDLADRHGVMVLADFHDDPRMPTVTGTRIYQIACNLIKNALDAMPDGGCLTVHTGIVKDAVVIRVEDTGPGLPADGERVFEPFFTTKQPGSGTGLGLAICREYLAQMGGTITAGNGPERGAIFTVRFPLSHASAAPDEAPGAALGDSP